ncbi:group III truncated hemoglobin [Nitratireductor kimnyeongensis]|uniref:Group III truncated hemoglobin n=2 Tax=Nitratireductor kimnyeongensis TaxID=430679 RepID=A0ABW0TDZ3_9HYPH|nr:group III truncated hemoglobin [Nitratireductor kimnyeongensis]QZZ37743.1 group III truncated hemoglobin [Nitratireductor kimnyeongensis]
MSGTFIVRPKSQPEEALKDPAVDREFIGRLVRAFYTRVRSHARLGPIFAGEIRDDWEPHLEKMTDFWCAVILKDGSYHGRPVPAHLKLKTVVEADFDIWLGLFRETVEELSTPSVATVFMERAERIAKSLKLAMFFRLPAALGPDVARTRARE